MFQCSEVEEQGLYHNCCLAVIGPGGTPDFGFEAVENLTILEGMAEADVYCTK